MEFSSSYAPINDGFSYHDKVSKAGAKMTVPEYYCKHHAASGTSEEWMHRIHNNQITFTATGKAAATDSVLKAGDRLTYFRLPWAEPAAPSSITILYEDEHVLGLAKPAGLQVLPKASFCQRTVLGLLQAYQQQVRRLRYPGSQQPVPVHRLGRGTSGTVQPNEGEVDVAIGPVSYPGLSSGLFAASTTGKPARSLFRVLHRHAGSTLVEVTILTGRPHQIRIHMAALGHPLLGDPLYGVGGTPLDTVVSGSRLGAYGDAGSAMPGEQNEE
ncbi:hypothetical protein OEZ85_007037 [Tetradesmus obliquus]|uniref:Pseudouridine synthase RsuA/RluA-like domain-containing protein n=1 Tax=Tetradesmus obliquus TaxID=3088 RepID=A0ABY8TYV7_TETOB|nr:hypothetical protein OEZ85_007037 [Tetradesmus obliquus]